MASKLYGVDATMIIFVFVLYFIVLYCIQTKKSKERKTHKLMLDYELPLRQPSLRLCAITNRTFNISFKYMATSYGMVPPNKLPCAY